MTLVICDKFCINNILEQPPKKLYKQICFKTLLINQNEILKKSLSNPNKIRKRKTEKPKNETRQKQKIKTKTMT